MLYGLYNRKGISRFILTRSDVLGEYDHSPWLTTSKPEAEERLLSLRGRYETIEVVPITVSTVVPWKFCEHRM
jgi:hypothetical protein